MAARNSWDEAPPEVTRSITQALRAAGEAVGTSTDGVLAMFDHDRGTTIVDFLRPDIIGLDDLRVTTRELENAQRAMVTYPSVLVQQITEDVAVSLASSRIDIVLSNGEPMQMNVRVTDVWRRAGDQWLAVHEHSSLPINASSGQVNSQGSLTLSFPHAKDH
jgi:hypothetical protein